MARRSRGCALLAALLLAGCGARPADPEPKPAASLYPNPATVAIIDVQSVEAGSGWVYDAEDGLVVTAHHILNGAKFADVKVGAGAWQRAKVVAADPCEDVALLQLRTTDGLETLPLTTASTFPVGTSVHGVGFTVQDGKRPSLVTFGTVRTARVQLGPKVYGRTTPAFDDLLEVTKMTAPGVDGGPLLDDSGRLTGMLLATNTEPDGTETSYAARVDRLREVLAAFERGVAPGWIGWALTFSPHITQPQGVIVTGIDGVRGGYANGGVLVAAINGIAVGDTFASWCRTAGRQPAGEATLTIVRRPGASAERVTVPVNRTRPTPTA
jgi:S1-C subfamily serine protease